MFLLTAFAVLAIAACTKEERESGITVYLGMDKEASTKADFSDANGIRWTAGDQVQVIGDAVYATPVSLISDYRASVNITDAGNYIFRYGQHGNDEFIFDNKLVQEEAGVMPSYFLHLHSGFVPESVAAGDAEKKMKIVGSILRFLPFTSSYTGESVESITLTASTNFLGTVGYKYSTGGSFKDFGGSRFWAGKNTGVVSLNTPMSLSGVTDKYSSNGLYMPVPAQAGTLDGYTIEVLTNVATYTFTTSSSLTIGENKLVNVPLNLDKAVRLEIGHFLMAFSKVTNNGDLSLSTHATSSDATGVYVGLSGVDGNMDGVSWTARVYSTLRGVSTYLTTYGTGGGTTLNNDGETTAYVSRTGVNGDFDFTFNISANPAPVERTWTIEVSTDNAMVDNSPLTFVITQAAGNGYSFYINKADQGGGIDYAAHYDSANDISTDVMPDGGAPLWIDVVSENGLVYSCNASYTQGGSVTDYHTWSDLTVAVGDDIPGFSFPANTLSSERIWTLTITTSDENVAPANRSYHIRFRQSGHNDSSVLK
ncbi:MAG: hypothetical protein IKZ91_04505 [Bacteroidales bacterium]|nr:hypothetical protein [Bacteroidales bacterium]